MRLLLGLAAALVVAPAAFAHTDTTSLRFAWPAIGTVTSPFGQDGGRWHPGIDICTLLYAHLAAPSVYRGNWVVTGQRLGTAGCTGWCTGTHLHFEFRYRGTPRDPSLLLG